jgi:hypothetical protein
MPEAMGHPADGRVASLCEMTPGEWGSPYGDSDAVVASVKDGIATSATPTGQHGGAKSASGGNGLEDIVEAAGMTTPAGTCR